MKKKSLFFPILFVTLLALSCKGVTNIDLSGGGIMPSDVIITESREVSGFTGIDMRTLGKVVLSQGDSESLTIQGSDNIVPIIETSLRDGILVIQSKEKINVTGLHDEKVLVFTIEVKDLSSLDISGTADVEMESLSTSALEITMSGAGQFVLDELKAESLNITLSGLGNIEASGDVTNAQIDIPGAGNVDASNLKIQTADVTISGLGGATVWVTDRLTGNISGGGGVQYYGNPQVDTETSGLGQFKSLGNK